MNTTTPMQSDEVEAETLTASLLDLTPEEVQREKNQLREQISRLETSKNQDAVGKIFTLIRRQHRLRELEGGSTRPERVMQVKLCPIGSDPYDNRTKEEKRVPPFDFDTPVGQEAVRAYQDAVRAQKAAQDR